MANHKHKYKYTLEMLTDAVAASVSIAGVLRYLGIPFAGGSHSHISRRIRASGLDTSHFTGQAHAKGTRRPRKPWSELLVEGSPEAGRRGAPYLRRALIEYGRPYCCSLCGNDGMWLGRELVLHVDHINGKHWDCRPENLRFLCPNCHAQTPTWCGRKASAMTRKDYKRRIDPTVPSAGHSQLQLNLTVSVAR